MYDVQQSDIKLLQQRVKTVYTKIQLLNAKFMVIDEIQGVFLDGSISTDAGSDVRNTFAATVLVKRQKLHHGRDVENLDRQACAGVCGVFEPEDRGGCVVFKGCLQFQ